MKTFPFKKNAGNFIWSHILPVAFILIIVLLNFPSNAISQTIDISKKLKGFDQYVDKVLKEWNIAGAGVGIVYKDKLVFAKGYGYRDFDQKLPFTPATLFQIASNTKLFTAISAGILVNQGKIDWDKPVRQYVPSIEFYNSELNNNITLRDMLSHRTGISRHDLIWYKSDFSRKELFNRIKYLEPIQPLRQGFLYNNLMYISAGYIIELLCSKTWEDFIQENIFNPLEMRSTVFTVKEMEKNVDHSIPFNEKRDTKLLYRIPKYDDQQAVGPAGAIISNIQDMSQWVITLLNNGKYKYKQIIPQNIIKATLEPNIPISNSKMEDKGYREILNPEYAMGRIRSSYRGHLLLYHGGSLSGFNSEVSIMPNDSIGVIVFVLGDQGDPVTHIVTYYIYERFLGLDQTPWNERDLKDHLENKRIDKERRIKSGSGRIAGTMPSHSISDYAGEYENPAYGIIKITRQDSLLQFEFHHMILPLSHFHYDRFDTPDDEQYGLWSLNFTTNPQGSIDGLFVSLDESQTIFTRKADASLSEAATLSKYVGKYKIAGNFINIELVANKLYVLYPGQPRHQLIPIKPNIFGLKEFPDYTLVFEFTNGEVAYFKQIDPSGEYKVLKIK